MPAFSERYCCVRKSSTKSFPIFPKAKIKAVAETENLKLFKSRLKVIWTFRYIYLNLSYFIIVVMSADFYLLFLFGNFNRVKLQIHFKMHLMLSHFKFWDWYCSEKGSRKNCCPSVHRIPAGVWAHLGDQKSGYLVEEGAPGSYWASNRFGQWDIEVGATLAPGREMANLVSCPLVVSSKGSVPSNLEKVFNVPRILNFPFQMFLKSP